MLSPISMVRTATWNVAYGHKLPVVLESVRALPERDLISLQELSIHDGRVDAQSIASRLGGSWRFEQVTAQVVAGRVQANGILWDARRMELLGLDTVAHPTPSGYAMRALPQ